MNTADVPAWSRDAAITTEKALLANQWYVKLSGATIKDSDAGLPWHRGVVVIQRIGPGGRGAVRRVFHGANAAKFKMADIGLDTLAMFELGVDSDNPVELRISIAKGPFGAAMDRALFYWRHPNDAARVAFKLGMLGVALGLAGVLEPLLNGIQGMLAE